MVFDLLGQESCDQNKVANASTRQGKECAMKEARGPDREEALRRRVCQRTKTGTCAGREKNADHCGRGSDRRGSIVCCRPNSSRIVQTRLFCSRVPVVMRMQSSSPGSSRNLIKTPFS